MVRRSCGSSLISAPIAPPSAPKRLLTGTRTLSKIKIEGLLCRGNRMKRDGQAFLRQLAHQRAHRAAFRPQEIADGDADVVEDQDRRPSVPRQSNEARWSGVLAAARSSARPSRRLPPPRDC